MNQRPLLLGNLLAALALTACGDSSLTCDLLEDEGNCWAQTALATAECLPTTSTGELSPDRSVCTFGDGSRVVFDEPLPEHDIDLASLAFDVERDGERCARFVDRGDNRMELTANEGTVVAQLHDSRAFTLRCPGGSTYETSLDALFDCSAKGIPLPSAGLLLETDRATFTIGSVLTPSVIFVCE